MATISAVYARVVVRRLEDLGVDAAQLFANTRLDSERLWAQAEIELLEFAALLDNAQRLHGEVPVGFLIGDYQGTHALGHLGVAMNAAPDLRAGLQVLQSFTAIHTTYIRVHLDARVSGTHVRLALTEEASPVVVSHAEASMMLFRGYVEMVSTRTFVDGRYEFAYPAPAHAARYPEFLGQNITFDCPATTVFVPAEWLALRSPFYNEEIWSQSMRQLAQRLKELGATDKRAFQRHIRLLLRSQSPPLPSLEAMADQLHVSPRTLNRRLQEEDTSYRELRADLMDEWSKSYLLETNDSVASIAATLGYSDVANFRRAFRGRNGMSFNEFRNAHSASVTALDAN